MITEFNTSGPRPDVIIECNPNGFLGGICRGIKQVEHIACDYLSQIPNLVLFDCKAYADWICNHDFGAVKLPGFDYFIPRPPRCRENWQPNIAASCERSKQFLTEYLRINCYRQFGLEVGLAPPGGTGPGQAPADPPLPRGRAWPVPSGAIPIPTDSIAVTSCSSCSDQVLEEEI